MVPIAITKVGKLYDDNFYDYLMNLCNNHKKENRACAFAFIVYDLDDNAIQQVLEDKNYWTALDKLSGNHLSVFYINSKSSYYKRRQKEIYQEEKKRQARISKKGHMQFFVPIPLQKTPLDKSIDFLKQTFNLSDNLKHPFILFFQSDGETILDYFVVTLKEEKLEDAFLELKRQIKNASESISHLKSDDVNYHQEIFNLIESGVKNGNTANFIKTKVIPRIPFGSTVSSFVKIGTHGF